MKIEPVFEKEWADFHSLGVRFPPTNEIFTQKKKNEISFLWSDSYFKQVKSDSKRIFQKKIFHSFSKTSSIFILFEWFHSKRFKEYKITLHYIWKNTEIRKKYRIRKKKEIRQKLC